MAGRRASTKAILSDANMKEEIKKYLNANIASMLADIDSLEDPKDRLNARMKLFEYVMPKVQAVKTTEANVKSNAHFLLDKESGL